MGGHNDVLGSRKREEPFWTGAIEHLAHTLEFVAILGQASPRAAVLESRDVLLGKEGAVAEFGE